jgi:hypothetical protein
MKILSRISLFVLGAAFSLFLTTSYVAAADDDQAEKVLSPEEVRTLIDGFPTVDDATAGTVPVETGLGFYDIYSRQIAFRENTKAYRASLEARRENYKKIYFDKRENYKENLNKIYRAETAEALKNKDAKGNSPEGDDIKEAKFEMEGAASESDESKDYDSSAVNSDKNGKSLKEEDIPPKEGEEGVVKKKVVTSDDAPEFDPADLPDEDEWSDDEWSDDTTEPADDNTDTSAEIEPDDTSLEPGFDNEAEPEELDPATDIGVSDTDEDLEPLADDEPAQLDDLPIE